MNATSPVHFNLVPRAQLGVKHKRDMFHLLTRHFEGVTPEQFARDLAEKSLVLLLTREDALVGFSTLLSYTTTFEDRAVNIIYSGDTIVAPEAWGTTALPPGWLGSMPCARPFRRGRATGCS
jgi:hypothetical protein